MEDEEGNVRREGGQVKVAPCHVPQIHAEPGWVQHRNGKSCPDVRCVHLAQHGLPSLNVGSSTGNSVGSHRQGCSSRLEERGSKNATLFAHPTYRAADMWKMVALGLLLLPCDVIRNKQQKPLSCVSTVISLQMFMSLMAGQTTIAGADVFQPHLNAVGAKPPPPAWPLFHVPLLWLAAF